MLKPASVLALAALALSACSAEGDLAGDLEIGGTEPAYWTVQVQHATGKSTISILGEPSFEGELPVKTNAQGGGYVLTSKSPNGDFAMNFTQKECFDGLADVARPWTVTVTWNGEILNGCARPV